MKRGIAWNRRLKAIAVGLGIALSLLTARHWYETYRFGHPICDNCRPDFPVLYSGARLMWENRSSLYDLERQLAIQKAIDRLLDVGCMLLETDRFRGGLAQQGAGDQLR